MQSIRTFIPIVILIAISLTSVLIHAENLPPRNPYMADSFWPLIHGGSDGSKISPQAGPLVKSRALRSDEIKWKATGPMESLNTHYSSLYPDGRRVMWVGTHQQLIKLDADTMETLSTYVMNKGIYISADDIERIDRKYDEYIAQDNRQAIFDMADKYIGDALRSEQIGNAYSLLTRDNEHSYYFKDPETGKRYLRFYGDAIEGDASSDIELKREWELPEFEGRPFVPFAMNMTFDGWLILASTTGQLLAVKTDFSDHKFVNLVPRDKNLQSLDAMQSFVRNGIVIDNNNGIYVVTQDFMARVQWTGTDFSIDPDDGAWTAKYPSGLKGSGTTPALMGWGEEDHLVSIVDGESKRLLAFWRDEIPADWKGIDGYDRRVAGVAPIRFSDDPNAPTRVENASTVMGYGIFFANELASVPPPSQGNNFVKNFLAGAISSGLSGSEAVGGTKWVWNTETRQLEQQWIVPLKLTGGMCTISSPTRVLYCISRHDGNFHLEGIDWDTGKTRVRYKLGTSVKFFPWNNMVVAPNGAVDLFNWLGMGIMRMQPKP